MMLLTESSYEGILPYQQVHRYISKFVEVHGSYTPHMASKGEKRIMEAGKVLPNWISSTVHQETDLNSLR